MKTQRIALLAIAIVCIALIGAAVFLQITERMLPCPKCVIQRYIFLLISLLCVIGAALPRRAVRFGAGLAFLASLGGIAAACWLLYVKAHPTITCGVDPVEIRLNKIPPAHWFPKLFEANGECTTPYPPVLGLDVSQWSLVWFAILAVALAWIAFRRR